jgi:hypothetical protein
MSHNFVYRRLLEAIERRAIRCGVAIKKVHPAYTSLQGKYKYATALGLSFHQAAAFVIARRGLGFHERIPAKIQALISVLIQELNKLLPAMEAKGKREVKRLLKKLDNWRKNATKINQVPKVSSPPEPCRKTGSISPSI